MLKIIKNLIRKINQKANGGDLRQDMNVPVGERYVTKGIPQLIRQAGAESAVLLKNDGALPLKSGDRVAVFGRCQRDYFYVGYGSGGDVTPPYKVSLLDAMKESDGKFILDRKLADIYEEWCSKEENVPFEGWWGHWPMNYPEMPLSDSLIADVAARNDIAVVVLGRAAGEDRENTLTKGSYYLTDDEISMLDRICAAFEKTAVIMNCGNVIDMSWTAKYGDRLSAILYAWQGGMESGRGVVDVLCGDVNPCGKLPDTIAANYSDYPSSDCFGNKDFNEYREDIFVGYRYFETFAKEKALFPFGFGLSYTKFEIVPKFFEYADGEIRCKIEVRNIGERSGKEIVQIYVASPQGRLGKAARVLAAFAKTEELAPYETQTLELSFSEYGIASFDDTGATGHIYSYVLEKGKYSVYVGSDCRTDILAGEFDIEEDKTLDVLQSVCPVRNEFKRICALERDGKTTAQMQTVQVSDVDLAKRIIDGIPEEIGYKGEQGYTFDDVISGKAKLDDFISQLGDRELEALTRGMGYMRTEYGASGNAGSYCATIPSLIERRVPPIVTADGPAGIRIARFTSLLPCGTALAATWNTDLVRRLYEKVGEEMRHYDVDVLLGAGMNIHRDPLCGRNFEYFSEDPLLSGKMAAAFVDGVQKYGNAACPKHFACNNQEFNRNYNDSRVSQRALREIYLKGFEICVKESDPLNIMTSYNKINGVWNHYNYDLVTTVLRKEWGFSNLVITDWWMRKSKCPEFPKIKDNAYRVRAQVDIYMPGNHSRTSRKYKSDGTLLATLGKDGGITRAELERTARNTLSLALKLAKRREALPK